MRYDRAYMADQIERLEELAEASRELVKDRFPDPPIGSGDPSDEEFERWFLGKLEQHPSVPIAFPDGQTRTMSPWIAALPFVEGGMELIERWDQTQGDG